MVNVRNFVQKMEIRWGGVPCQEAQEASCKLEVIGQSKDMEYQACSPSSRSITSYLEIVRLYVQRSLTYTHIPNMMAALGTTLSMCGVSPPYSEAIPSSLQMVVKHCTIPVYFMRPSLCGACRNRVRTTSWGYVITAAKNFAVPAPRTLPPQLTELSQYVAFLPEAMSLSSLRLKYSFIRS